MIPGYLQNGNHSHSVDLFFKEQRMAMYPNWVAAMITFFTRAGTKDSFKWDVMAHPSYPDRPGLGKEVDFAIAVVNKSSKYREAAYQVLLSLLSENVQTKQSKAGRLSVLKNEDIRKVYGSDSDIYKGKNLQSIFKVTPSPLPDASKYDPKINALLIGEIVKSVTVGGTDINTALRNAEDKANKEIVIP
jgi:multiple sugar transport system substrate-binding protein